MIARIRYALGRRPIRILEAAIALAAALGYAFAPDVEEAVLALAVAVVALLEVVQTGTTPLFDPRDRLGRSLVPSEDPHAHHHYD